MAEASFGAESREFMQNILVVVWQGPSSWELSHTFTQQVFSLKTDSVIKTRQGIGTCYGDNLLQSLAPLSLLSLDYSIEQYPH